MEGTIDKAERQELLDRTAFVWTSGVCVPCGARFVAGGARMDVASEECVEDLIRYVVRGYAVRRHREKYQVNDLVG